ncbi:TraR/DksA family transcriptional regulator [Shewanella maritima]|uniref:TraR/DksA family transcriptional regulator n=1 Tax=Shewanella maritima TaxID=2520507 RepID=UPI003736463C
MNEQNIKQTLIQLEIGFRIELTAQLQTPLIAQQKSMIDINAPLNELIEQLSKTHMLDSAIFDKFVQLDAALCQLELGLYGICSDCEMEIEPERLLINPTEQRCANCAEKYNAEHRHELRLSH